MNIRESQIEDVLASHTDIARLTLNLSGDLTLIARQKILISGDRIDLLFVCDNQVLLVELKIERFQRKFLEQTQRYAEQLRALQTCGALVAGEINPFLVCTKVSEADKAKAHRAGGCATKSSACAAGNGAHSYGAAVHRAAGAQHG